MLSFLLPLLPLVVYPQVKVSIDWPLVNGESSNLPEGVAYAGFNAGNGITDFRYDPTDGATAGGWNTLQLDNTAYYEFKVLPANGNSLNIEQLYFQVSLNLVNMRTAIHYSLDGFRNQSIPIGNSVFISNSSSRDLYVNTSIPVKFPDTLSIRIYGWSAPTPDVSFFTRNVSFKGSISILNLTNTSTNTGSSSPVSQTVLLASSGSERSIAAVPLSFDVQGGGSYCAGTNGVTISLSGSEVGVTYDLLLNGQPSGITSISGTGSPISFNNITSAGTYTITGTNVDGQTPMTGSATVTVIPTVVPSVSIVVNPGQTICSGTEVRFTATPVNGGDNPTYQWYIGASPVATGAEYITTTLANGNQVRVVMTTNATCPSVPTVTSNVLTMTVNPIVVPSISIESTATTICEGTPVTFSVDNLQNGGLNPVYQWNVNGNPVGSNANSYTASDLVNSDIVTLNVTSSATCATPQTVTSNQIPVTVNPNLPVSIELSSTNLPVCEGELVSFTTTSTNEGVNPVYQWKVNGVVTGTNTNIYTSSTLKNNDIVSVTLTSTATCATGNPATDEIQVSITPNSSVSVQVAASQTSICEGTSVTFTATGTNGGVAPVYQWFLNGSPAVTNSNVYESSTLNNNDVITVSLTSDLSCTTGNPATSNPIQITVNPIVPASVSITASSTDICAGTNVSFTATPVNGGTTPTYQWKVNGADVGSNSGTFSSSTLSNGQVVSVVMTSNAPCVINSPATSEGITMTVNPVLPVSVSIAANTPTTICAGTSVTFTATPTNGGTTPTYQWLLNGANIGTGSTYTTSSLSNNDEVKVILTSSIPSCTTGNPATSNVIKMTVNPMVTPSVSISSPVTSICSGSPVTFTTTPTYGGSAPTYRWFNNGTAIQGATGSTYSSSNLTNGSIISVVMTSNATCTTSTTATSNQITMAVFPSRPQIGTGKKDDTQPRGPTSICPPATGLVYSIPITMTNGETYNWSVPPGFTIVSGQGTSQITVNILGPGAVTGNNNITVTASNPCGSVSSNPLVVVIASFAAVSAGIDVSLCLGTPTNLTNVLSGNATTVTWSLISGTGTITGGPYAIPFVYTPTSSGTAVLRATTNTPIGGGCSNTPGTDEVTIITYDPVSITTQPLATQTECSGSTISLSVVATGSNLTYQWRKGTTNLVNGGRITGATSNTLSITGATLADAGTYNVVVSGSAPCSPVTSQNAVVTVNEAIVITQQPEVNQSACTGNTVNFSVTATGGITNYQWMKGSTPLVNDARISGATTSKLTITNVNLADASDYHVVINGTPPCLPATSNISTLVVHEAVSITSQPVANITECSGATITMQVSATGSDLKYQWKKGSTNLTNSGNISGATSATLVISNSAVGDAGSYTVEVSGNSPCNPGTSTSTIVVINEKIEITAQPLSSQTACTGTPVSFTVTAKGTNPKYQWRRGNQDLIDNASISGTTTSTLTINSVTLADAASDYYVVISGVEPCDPVTSNLAALIVNEGINVTSQPPLTQAACTGSTVTLTIEATGSNLTYQWRKGTTNLSNTANITGVTTNTLQITNVTLADAAANYNVVIKGNDPCPSFTSPNYALVVNRAVAINTQPSNVGVCASSPAQLYVVASGDGLTYQWYKGEVPGVAVSNSSFVSGAQSNTLNFSQAFLADAGSYYVVVSGASACPTVTSNVVTLNIDQSIVITSQPVPVNVCENEPNITFSVTANAGGDPLSYQWRKDGVNISGANSSTYTVTLASLATAGNYDVVISGPSGYTCPNVTSTAAKLTITPTVGTPTAITINNGLDPTCQLTNNTTTTQYATTATNSTGFTWSLSNSDAGTINPQTGLMTWANGYAGTVDIKVVAQGCNGPSQVVTRTVSITPTVGTPTAITVSAGDEPNCQIINSTTKTTYSTTASNSTGFNWSISNNAAGTINASTGEMTWSNGFQGTVNIIVTANGCNGPSASVTKPVTITPTVSITPYSSLTSTRCQGAETLTYTTTATNHTSLTYSLDAASLAAGNSINASTGAVTFAASWTGTTTITATAEGCNGPATTAHTVTVTPSVTISPFAQLSSQRCQGAETITYTTTAQNATAIAYSLDANSLAGGNTINPSTGSVTFSPSWSGISTITASATGCNGPVTTSHTVTTSPSSVGGSILPATSIVCKGDNSGTLTLSGHTGSIVRWETSTDAGTNWNVIASTSTTITYSNLNQSALYRAVVESGNCGPAYSEFAVVSVITPFAPSVTTSPSPPIICFGASAILTANSGILDQPWIGTYNNANPAGWKVDGSSNDFPSAPANEQPGPWGRAPNDKTYGGLNYSSIGGAYAVVNGAVNSSLETPVFALVGMSSAYLNIIQAMRLSAGAVAKIQISTDGGATYTTLGEYIGPLSVGNNNGLSPTSFNLLAYLGQVNLRIRFQFSGKAGSTWANDNVFISDKVGGEPYQYPITYQWTPVVNMTPANGLGPVVTVSPGVTTTYTVNTSIATANATCPLGSASVEVIVIPNPIVQPVNACVGGGTVTFTQTEGPAGGTWSVSGGGVIDKSTGVFTPTTPGCYTVTYTTLQASCSDTESFLVFPAAPIPVVDAGCGPIIITPPAAIAGFDLQYSFDDGLTWGGNTPPVADNCDGFKIRTRYISNAVCGLNPIGTLSTITGCDISPAVTRIVDNTPPTASNPAPLAVQCIEDVPAANVEVVIDEADNCTLLPTVEFVSDVPDGSTCPLTITRTYKVSDACGNFINITHTITVNDDIAPTASNPAPVTVSCKSEVPTADILVVLDEADNCGTPVVAFVSDVSDNNTCPEVITRTYSITDACQNQILVTQTITVDDKVLPTADNLSPIAAQCKADIPLADITAVTNAQDNCGNVVVSFISDVSDVQTCPETITRTYRVTDDCGNSIDLTQIITVNDDILPVITCPAPIAISAQEGMTYALVTIPEIEYSDNCSLKDAITFTWIIRNEALEIIGQGTGPISAEFQFPVGQNTVTLSVTDECGNVSVECTFTVTVTPNDPPDIECPPAIAQNTDAGQCYATLNPGSPTLLAGSEPITWTWVMTNSDGTIIAQGTGKQINPVDPFTYQFPVEVTTITWTATNISGTDECIQTIIVTDKEPPTFTAPGPFEECVELIFEASYYRTTMDITPTRPDYFQFNPGDEMFNINLSTITDNCCDPGEMIINWRIDFQGGSPSSITGTGQPSTYANIIQFPGDGSTFQNLVHTITYWLVDCNQNASTEQTVNITIKPRPNVTKQP